MHYPKAGTKVLRVLRGGIFTTMMLEDTFSVKKKTAIRIIHLNMGKGTIKNI